MEGKTNPAAEPFAILRRRIYLAFCLMGLTASTTGFIYALLSNEADFFRQVLSYLIIGMFGLMSLLAGWKRLSLARLEQTLFGTIVSLSLLTLVYVLYREYPKPSSFDVLLSLLLWFPGVYVMIFFVFKAQRAVVLGSSLLLAFIALSLPHALRTTIRQNVFDGITPFLQIYLSHVFIILALYGFAVFRAHALKQEQEAQAFRELASTDMLTGLSNRRHMTDLLELEFKRAERYDHPFSIILLDIDRFKFVNDVYGHDVGDEVLVDLAHLLQSSLRGSDLAARWGGEEFLVLLPETSNSNALIVAENLRKQVAMHLTYRGNHSSISSGVASYHPNDSLKSLVKRADDALYKAKAQGRNCVVNEKLETLINESPVEPA
ncbi:MAG: diguanylate cyclase [Trueperaceae bacterium]|nr:diguanylate cyclase [Trueperaceae bacterium]